MASSHVRQVLLLTICFTVEFAFYVNKNGWRSKGNWIIHWEGHPTSFALHHPYVLAFEPSFIEVRHVDTGALHQVITGASLRCLFADVPPPAPPAQVAQMQAAAAQMQAMNAYGRPKPPMYNGAMNNLQRAQSFNVMAPYQRPPLQMMAGPPGAAPMPYGPPRPPMPGMPYGFPQQMAMAPPPRPAAAPVSPMWESAFASRSHIVFQGDGTVFCVKLAGPKEGSSAKVEEIPV